MKWQATVKTKSDKQSFDLPFTIGATSDSSVVVNIDGLQSSNFHVSAVNSALQVIDLKNNSPVTLAALSRVGISLTGPTKVSKGVGKLIQILGSKIFQAESFFVKFTPNFLRRRAESYSQATRLMVEILFLANIFATGFLLYQAFSHQEISTLKTVALTLNNVHAPIVGASPTRKGFEKGANFTIGLNESNRKVPKLLRFDVAGIDVVKELVVLVNDRKMADFGVDELCPEGICNLQFRIEPSFLKVGQNKITFVHTDEGSPYMLRNILISEVPQPSVSDSEELQQYQNLSARFYEERTVSAENLTKAYTHIVKAEKLSGLRSYPLDLVAKIKLDRATTEKEREDQIKKQFELVESLANLKKITEAKSEISRLEAMLLGSEEKHATKLQNLKKAIEVES